ncbi:endonuclease [Flavobacterium phage vB_FspS_tooticki9-1]|uniref:Endonuclease n=14 Tax=Caudoviricetes TaxID=2731619 RepID=A0A6B9LS16_9CAUD|nr:endonuclease [Flavobacterium phage vB_FspS_hattifnatt9-1]YP_009854765.1 endonuclease [Flavobacterium phage vB_FspS_hemulen6-1]YP_009855177.1 endonuclease [Flavobacterium phage vB_FspS_sniff9-1]YP_009855250.1 endonuclease [Flavobacterium phage vB_FspS_snork6-1]YP_009855323.1 endonuclease [Flavobacterium phage vB_FspS_snusmum6-1]YP_009855389.1 endonuclease [Flavobacterium phage vB_FspS_stinky9-1]YP_009855518.1 endonuclease [Flavobacterium phage vB_FspS_tooticki6-1]QHB38868.1 endonuclease [F
MDIEIWLQVFGFDDYQISNYGNVKSLKNGKEKILKAVENGRGYLSVCLRKDKIAYTKRVHVLVCESFLNHFGNGTTEKSIDHIDNNKLNNKLSNLQIISHRENIVKSVKNKTGLTGAKKHGEKYCSYITINNKYKHLGVFKTALEAHNRYKQEVLILNK